MNISGVIWDKNRFGKPQLWLIWMTPNGKLCDGCAKCCLIKLQDEETEDIVFTDIACHFVIKVIAAARNMKRVQNWCRVA